MSAPFRLVHTEMGLLTRVKWIYRSASVSVKFEKILNSLIHGQLMPMQPGRTNQTAFAP